MKSKRPLLADAIKFLICPLFAFISMAANCQLVADDFSDGNLTAFPIWTGDVDSFVVNGTQQLQLNAPAAVGQSYLTTSFAATTLDEKEWHFYTKLAFDGSTNNQTRIYFASSGAATSYTTTGSAGVTGYFMRIGESGTADVIRIFRDNGSSVTELAAGTTVTTGSSFDASFKITRDNLGNWNVFIDPAGGDNFVLEVTFTDNTYSTATNFGVICTYSASNSDNFFYDDIYFGDLIVDTEPPGILSANATGSNTVDVLFSEAVDATSAETEANYSLAPSVGLPSTATLDGVNHAIVHLTFSSGFIPNDTYTLTVNNVQDESGNEMPAAQEVDFEYAVLGIATARDVVFNEILADKNPTQGLPEAEFVELRNTHATDSYDLAGWKFVNTTTVKILPSFILSPGAFVILCDDDSASVYAANYGPVISIPSFTALSDGGDSLTLKNAADEIIDVVVYSDDWFLSSTTREGGWSLELINPLLPCQSASNWHESVNENGGTPGSENSVYNGSPDLSPPAVTMIEMISSTELLITFSETMSSLSADDALFLIPFNEPTSFEWNNTITHLTLHFPLELSVGTEHIIQITGLTDCSGNVLPDLPYSFIEGVQPEPGDIIINEIMFDPNPVVDGPEAEYIELYNRTDHVIELSDIKINNGSFESQVIIYPDSFMVISDDANALAFLSYPGTVFMATFPGLTETGTTITIYDQNNNALDSVHYTSDWYRDGDKDNGGYSIELINPNDVCSNFDNWRASVDVSGCTPGRRNSVFDPAPDTQAPHLLFVLSEPMESISLVFDEPLDAESLAGLSWTVNGEVQNDFGAQFINPDKNAVVLHYGEMETGVIYNFELLGLSDCWGNDAGIIKSVFALPDTAQVGDLLVNEILCNPYDGGKDFVEIYNNSTRVISLANWQIADISASGVISEPDTITNQNVLLLPGDYLVITTSGNPLSTFYPGTRNDRVWIVEAMPDFSSGDPDEVLLYMPDGTLSDRVPFDEGMHYPLLNDPDGVSLERIAFDRPSTDRTNWHSASEFVSFATPGYQNSQSAMGVIADAEFSVGNEIFSPDNDGHQDVVTFAFRLDQPGYTGNIKIFDSEGRLIRHLMKSELLGGEGNISWDGFNEENQKASIGIYVVFFEAFNPDGNVVKSKKTCVLAHQLN